MPVTIYADTEYTGRIDPLIDQLAKETFAPGLHHPDKSWVLIEITRSAMNYVYLGRPTAFPLNVDWKYTQGTSMSLTP